MNATNGEIQSFHFFPNLPIELRCKVWHRILRLFPRIIEVRPNTTAEAWNPLTTKYHVQTTSPIVPLSINHEAREELLPFYTALSSDVSLNLIPDSDNCAPNTANRLMVNFEADTIYFNVAWYTNERVPYLSFVQRLFQDFEQDKWLVRRVAVPLGSEFIRPELLFVILEEVKTGQDRTETVERSVICMFNGLEEFIMVTEQRHLKVGMKLAALVENGKSARQEISQSAKGQEGQLLHEWRVPKIKFCSTIGEPVKVRNVDSRSSYLERVYGHDFVKRFMATHD
ncbi:hypothetical protein EYC84_000993 [Monilinia fructicola]|uniref:2EXR domain-containing protein n=1 Tax=Monilinia fructicola TaxID=38448 RepID=A0A5M9JJ85_MONFR|nr:hypothetical protein EYC84_000993 [Monilinia fructicola]